MGLIFNYVHLDRTNKIVDLANSDVIFNEWIATTFDP
jgi:hypothetical protein